MATKTMQRGNQISPGYEDDMRQEGFIAGIRASRRWDPSRSKYATYVFRRVLGAMKDLCQRKSYWRRVQVNNKIESVFYWDKLPDEEAMTVEDKHHEIQEFSDLQQRLYTRILESERFGYPSTRRLAVNLLKYIISGHTQADAAREFCMSESRVSQIVKRVGKHWEDLVHDRAEV